MSHSQDGKESGERKKAKKEKTKCQNLTRRRKPPPVESPQSFIGTIFPHQRRSREIGNVNSKFRGPPTTGKTFHLGCVDLKYRRVSSKTDTLPTATFPQGWACNSFCFQTERRIGTEPEKSGNTAPTCHHHDLIGGMPWRRLTKRWSLLKNRKPKRKAPRAGVDSKRSRIS